MITSNIFDNKPIFVPTWQLYVAAEPGAMIDGIWQPNADLDFSTWDLKIYYDSTLLGTQIKPVLWQAVDNIQYQEHTLRLVLDFQHQTLGQMLQIKICIEGVDVVPVLIAQPKCYETKTGQTKYGSNLMGEPGTQTLKIQTPIYRWLLSHEKLVTKH